MARTLLSLALTAGLLVSACADDKGDTTPPITTMITTHIPSTSNTSTGQSTTDDSGSGSAGQSTGGDTTSAIASTSTSEPDSSTGDTTAVDTTTGDGTTGTTGEPDPIETCLEMVELGDECGECGCMNCLEELGACQADEGCVEIRQCAEDAGCNGIDCLGPCSDVINFYGGPFGPSGTLSQALGLCLSEQCPGLCTN